MPDVDWGDVATWLGAMAAIAAAVVAWVQARRSQAEARESREQAGRSVEAAERSAAAVERQVALAEAEATRPPWDVRQVARSKYHLVNDSNSPVYRVSVAASFVIGNPLTRDRLGPGEAVDFVVALPSGDDAITVNWFPLPDQAGDPEVWRYPIP